MACRIFSKHFLSTLCIWKTLLGIQCKYWYNSEHHATRRNDLATAESYFCRFLENHTPSKPKFKIRVQKKLFSTVNEAWFLVCRNFSKRFPSTLCIWKFMFRVRAIFWYNLEHHTTLRNDFAAAESHFCRFLEIDTPKELKYFDMFWKFMEILMIFLVQKYPKKSKMVQMRREKFSDVR